MLVSQLNFGPFVSCLKWLRPLPGDPFYREHSRTSSQRAPWGQAKVTVAERTQLWEGGV